MPVKPDSAQSRACSGSGWCLPLNCITMKLRSYLDAALYLKDSGVLYE